MDSSPFCFWFWQAPRGRKVNGRILFGPTLPPSEAPYFHEDLSNPNPCHFFELMKTILWHRREKHIHGVEIRQLGLPHFRQLRPDFLLEPFFFNLTFFWHSLFRLLNRDYFANLLRKSYFFLIEILCRVFRINALLTRFCEIFGQIYNSVVAVRIDVLQRIDVIQN